jgi:hypothetical protein
MQESTTTPFDVIRAYHAVELLKKKKLWEVSRDSQLATIEKVIKNAKKLTEKELLNHLLDGYHARYDNYFNSSWQLLEIPLASCGCWPDVGGLKGFTTRLLPDTAEKVSGLLKNPRDIKYKHRAVLYILEMTKISSLLNEIFPITVMAGGEIRNNKFSRNDKRSYCETAKYDIEDGNHRAIAHWLNGNKTIKAFVGTREYKSPYLYY